MEVNRVIIVGAGPAGLFAARTFLNRNPKGSVIILEKESRGGGKCYTYRDESGVLAEYGADLVALNYTNVLAALREKKLPLVRKFVAETNHAGIFEKLDKIASKWEKIKFKFKLSDELIRFALAVKQYRKFKKAGKQLPDDFLRPFDEYRKIHNMHYINSLLKTIVTGFGYGSMEDFPTYTAMEYMGFTTLPLLVLFNNSLQSIQSGFQKLMESIAEDFIIYKSVKIIDIQRDSKEVQVCYKNAEGMEKKLVADALILAISPLGWGDLGMQLTAIEQLCVEQLKYYRYPIVICKLKNMPANHIYVAESLEKNGFGHVALIATRDGRESPRDGRLCTVFINLPPGNVSFTFDKETMLQIEDDLKKLGITEITVLDTKIWEDHMQTLAWDLRLLLDKNQFNKETRTLYAGAYTLGGFDDVESVAQQSAQIINHYLFYVPRGLL